VAVRSCDFMMTSLWSWVVAAVVVEREEHFAA